MDDMIYTFHTFCPFTYLSLKISTMGNSQKAAIWKVCKQQNRVTRSMRLRSQTINELGYQSDEASVSRSLESFANLTRKIQRERLRLLSDNRRDRLSEARYVQDIQICSHRLMTHMKCCSLSLQCVKSELISKKGWPFIQWNTVQKILSEYLQVWEGIQGVHSFALIV